MPPIVRLPIRRHPGALFAALFLIFAGTATVAAPPRASQGDVLRATLPNGLRVIIVRNTLAPVVATSVDYLVGSDEAPTAFPGMAHAQEHMMFRGSPGLSADQLANIGSVMGGNFNANTRESVTQYLFTVPTEDLDIALHIEAARMSGVLDTQEGWDKERGAIEQEVAQDLSTPTYILYEKLRAILFAGTPYEHVALGTRASFDLTTAPMLKQFHDAWYAPNNAILIVVGDVEPKTALGEIKQLFGGIKPKKLPARPKFALQPIKTEPLTIDTDRPEGTELLAIRMPGLDSPDFPALELLSDVLNSHRFELYGLVPQGKAVDAGFALDPLPKSAVGYAQLSFTGNSDPAALESDVRSILRNVAKNGVPPDLVAAAKLQEERQTEFEKNSISELASTWSDAVALYGLHAPDDDLVRMEKVTPADVNRVAREYLKLDDAVVAVALPKGSGRPAPSSGGFGGNETITLAETPGTILPAWATADLNRLVVPPSTLSPTVSTLSNGLTLIVQPETVSDTVSIVGHVRNRPETETPPGQDGVSLILDQLFPYGSEKLDRLAYQQALDSIGAAEAAGPDFAIEVLARNFDRGAELLADNELHPGLPQAAMDTLRSQIAQLVAARNASPSHLTQLSLRKALYTAADPSLRDATPESVGALTLDQVRTYYRTVFRPDMTTIVVIGKVTPEQARAGIEKYFGGWQASGPVPQTDLPLAPPNAPAAIAVPDDSRVQDNVVLAQDIALNRSDADFYALELGNAVLGGGFYSTRLSIDLRKNSGLVYSVSSQLQSGRTRSAYLVQYACDPQNVGKAATTVASELRKIQTAAIGDDELNRAKALLLRRIPLSEASIDDIARGFLDRRDLELPLDEPTIAGRKYIELSPAAVQTAFQKWIRPDDLVRVSQGPPPG
jgi:zinc protease